MGEKAVDRSWTVEEVVPLLRELSFFHGMPDEDLEVAASLLERFPVEDGFCLFRQEDGGNAFYIVLEGEVELSLALPSGSVEKLAIRRPGECLGAAPLLHGGPQSASAVALGETVLLRCDEAGFRQLLTNNLFAVRVLEAFARVQRALELRLWAQERLSHKVRENGPDLRDVSRIIQRGLLPREAPSIQGFDLAAGTRLEAGGSGRTMWDCFQLKDGRRGLVSFNVLGEGFPAGHLLVLARSLLRELARDQDDLRGLLARLNSGVAWGVVEGMEQSMEAGILLPSGSSVEWACAGRCPGGVIRRRTGVFQGVASHGPPLGVLAGFHFGVQRLELGSGDAVLALSEASQGILRGAADLVASLQGKPVGEVVSTLQKALKKAGTPDVSILFARKQ